MQASIERRHEIMRDSRLGTFGVLALVTATLLRVALIADLALDGPRGAASGADRRRRSLRAPPG